jgi:hypothetical protein
VQIFSLYLPVRLSMFVDASFDCWSLFNLRKDNEIKSSFINNWFLLCDVQVVHNDVRSIRIEHVNVRRLVYVYSIVCKHRYTSFLNRRLTVIERKNKQTKVNKSHLTSYMSIGHERTVIDVRCRVCAIRLVYCSMSLLLSDVVERTVRCSLDFHLNLSKFE